ncbi:MAG TPA: tryptophan halogenase [Cellvibrio sp.]|nr:tryptophan halogenase [Cellvibrio sp.]
MNSLVKKIVIVGGGTAGWLTAGILAAEYKNKSALDIQITLVESPDINPIGVGEGTWPSMRATLRKIGISEADLVTQCAASFKQGSKFVGWKTGLEGDVYHHPFTIPNGYLECNLVAAWQTQFSDLPFADVVSVQNYVSESGCSPKQFTTPEYAGAVNYGYHLDAGKFGELLQKHCTAQLGVKHILDHVTHVISAPNGDIAAINTKEVGAIEGDLFIDCTGFACLLLGQHFGISFVDKKNFSLNDSALAAQVPYPEEISPIASSTIATAQSAGWTWDIGLSSRRGVGYVYSSTHISDDHAERELRAHIAKSVGVDAAEKVSTRKLAIRAGHREQFWYKNCVAIGMAAGFIEPLEASALALVELSANMIRDEFPLTSATMPLVAKRFNSVFQYRWERIVEFLKLHYVLTERRDTEYWRDMSSPDAIPEQLQQQLLLWAQRPPYINDLIQVEETFPSASYQYVLYGMGFKSNVNGVIRASDNVNLGLEKIKDNFERSRKYANLLPSNRELIVHIFKYGMQKI